MMIKKSWNLIGQEAHQATSNKTGSLRCYIPLMIMLMQKI